MNKITLLQYLTLILLLFAVLTLILVSLHCFSTLILKSVKSKFDLDNSYFKFSNFNIDNHLIQNKLYSRQNHLHSKLAREIVEPTEIYSLDIKSISLTAIILKGEDAELLNDGIWNKPNGVNPGERGNLILTGHRFAGIKPADRVFYNLDKVLVGDIVTVTYNGSVFDYVVFDTFEVNPEDTWVENNDFSFAELTLYTCTPLWVSDRRLIVKAKLKEY